MENTNTTNLTIRVDKKLKKDVEKLFKDIGINTSSAITMFFKECKKEQGLPFRPSLKPTKELKESLKEVEKIERGKIVPKFYDSAEEMMEDLLKDED